MSDINEEVLAPSASVNSEFENERLSIGKDGKVTIKKGKHISFANEEVAMSGNNTIVLDIPQNYKKIGNNTIIASDVSSSEPFAWSPGDDKYHKPNLFTFMINYKSDISMLNFNADTHVLSTVTKHQRIENIGENVTEVTLQIPLIQPCRTNDDIPLFIIEFENYKRYPIPVDRETVSSLTTADRTDPRNIFNEGFSRMGWMRTLPYERYGHTFHDLQVQYYNTEGLYMKLAYAATVLELSHELGMSELIVNILPADLDNIHWYNTTDQNVDHFERFLDDCRNGFIQILDKDPYLVEEFYHIILLLAKIGRIFTVVEGHFTVLPSYFVTWQPVKFAILSTHNRPDVQGPLNINPARIWAFINMFCNSRFEAHMALTGIINGADVALLKAIPTDYLGLAPENAADPPPPDSNNDLDFADPVFDQCRNMYRYTTIFDESLAYLDRIRPRTGNDPLLQRLITLNAQRLGRILLELDVIEHEDDIIRNENVQEGIEQTGQRIEDLVAMLREIMPQEEASASSRPAPVAISQANLDRLNALSQQVSTAHGTLGQTINNVRGAVSYAYPDPIDIVNRNSLILTERGCSSNTTRASNEIANVAVLPAPAVVQVAGNRRGAFPYLSSLINARAAGNQVDRGTVHRSRRNVTPVRSSEAIRHNTARLNNRGAPPVRRNLNAAIERADAANAGDRVVYHIDHNDPNINASNSGNVPRVRQYMQQRKMLLNHACEFRGVRMPMVSDYFLYLRLQAITLDQGPHTDAAPEVAAICSSDRIMRLNTLVFANNLRASSFSTMMMSYNMSGYFIANELTLVEDQAISLHSMWRIITTTVKGNTQGEPFVFKIFKWFVEKHLGISVPTNLRDLSMWNGVTNNAYDYVVRDRWFERIFGHSVPRYCVVLTIDHLLKERPIDWGMFGYGSKVDFHKEVEFENSMTKYSAALGDCDLESRSKDPSVWPILCPYQNLALAAVCQQLGAEQLPILMCKPFMVTKGLKLTAQPEEPFNWLPNYIPDLRVPEPGSMTWIDIDNKEILTFLLETGEWPHPNRSDILTIMNAGHMNKLGWPLYRNAFTPYNLKDYQGDKDAGFELLSKLSHGGANPKSGWFAKLPNVNEIINYFIDNCRNKQPDGTAGGWYSISSVVSTLLALLPAELKNIIYLLRPHKHNVHPNKSRHHNHRHFKRDCDLNELDFVQEECPDLEIGDDDEPHVKKCKIDLNKEKTYLNVNKTIKTMKYMNSHFECNEKNCYTFDENVINKLPIKVKMDILEFFRNNKDLISVEQYHSLFDHVFPFYIRHDSSYINKFWWPFIRKMYDCVDKKKFMHPIIQFAYYTDVKPGEIDLLSEKLNSLKDQDHVTFWLSIGVICLRSYHSFIRGKAKTKDRVQKNKISLHYNSCRSLINLLVNGNSPLAHAFIPKDNEIPKDFASFRTLWDNLNQHCSSVSPRLTMWMRINECIKNKNDIKGDVYDWAIACKKTGVYLETIYVSKKNLSAMNRNWHLYPTILIGDRNLRVQKKLKNMPNMKAYFKGYDIEEYNDLNPKSQFLVPYIKQGTTREEFQALFLADLVYRFVNTNPKPHYQANIDNTARANRLKKVNKLLSNLPIGTNNLLAMAYFINNIQCNDAFGFSLHNKLGMMYVSGHEQRDLFKELTTAVKRSSTYPDGTKMVIEDITNYMYTDMYFGRSRWVINWADEYNVRCVKTTHFAQPNIIDLSSNCLPIPKLIKDEARKRGNDCRTLLYYEKMRSKMVEVCTDILSKGKVRESSYTFFMRRNEWTSSGSSGGQTVDIPINDPFIKQNPNLLNDNAVKGGKVKLKVMKRAVLESMGARYLANMVEKRTPRESAKGSNKLENAKKRSIFGCDIFHYMISSYATQKIEESLHRVKGCEKGLSGVHSDRCNNLKRKITADGSYECTMFDYADFNAQHTPKMQSLLHDVLAECGEKLGFHEDYVKYNQWLSKAKFNMCVQFPGDDKYHKVFQGMFSGTKATDLMNTIINVCHFRIAKDNVKETFSLEPTDLYNVHQGDDVWISNKNEIWSACAYWMIQAQGADMRDDKQDFGTKSGEFLRVCYKNGKSNGYLHRKIAACFLRPVMEPLPIDPREWATNIQAECHIMQSRGLSSYATSLLYDSAVEYWCRLRAHGNDKASVRVPKSVIAAPTYANGFGNPPPNTITDFRANLPPLPTIESPAIPNSSELPTKMSDEWIAHVSSKTGGVDFNSKRVKEQLVRSNYYELSLAADQKYVRKKLKKAWSDWLYKSVNERKHLEKCRSMLTIKDTDTVADVCLTIGTPIALGVHHADTARYITMNPDLPKEVKAFRVHPYRDVLAAVESASPWKSLAMTARALGMSHKEALSWLVRYFSKTGIGKLHGFNELAHLVNLSTMELIEVLCGPSYSIFSSLNGHVRSSVLHEIISHVRDIYCWSRLGRGRCNERTFTDYNKQIISGLIYYVYKNCPAFKLLLA
nr:MAG: polyprotein [Giez virus]